MGHALDNTANAEFVNFEQNKLEHILTKLVDALAREAARRDYINLPISSSHDDGAAR
jgi:hypothetical protein